MTRTRDAARRLSTRNKGPIMNEELKSKLERFLPIRMVVRIHEGKVQGRTEHSFGMDWDDKRVNVFWSGKAFSIVGEHQLDGISWAARNLNKFDVAQFVIDPLAEDSPIEVDWETWLADASRKPVDKYTARNAPFTVKPHGTWQLRALSAERQYAELKPRYDSACKRGDSLDDQLDKLRAIINPQEVTDDEDA